MRGLLAGVPDWWCRSATALPGAGLLYFHAGGYVVGTALEGAIPCRYAGWTQPGAVCFCARVQTANAQMLSEAGALALFSPEGTEIADRICRFMQ